MTTTMSASGSSMSGSVAYRKPLHVRLIHFSVRVIQYALVILVGFIFLFPWLWLLSTSLKPPQQMLEIPPRLIPDPIMWINYYYGVTYINFSLYLRNTIFLCVVTLIGRVISCSLVAYSLSHVNWSGKRPLFVIVLATMMLPGQVTMIPIFIIFSRLGWVNTYLPLLVPTFFGDAFFIFMLRQFFLGIPKELTDAARLDGATHFDIYRLIIMPLSRPAVATVLAFTFINTFNAFQGPLIYLKNRELWTLSLGMQGYLQRYGAGGGTALGAMMAAAMLYTLPMVIVFFLAQKWFIQGIVTTGFK
jgi:multiple sugar transport system permease protein